MPQYQTFQARSLKQAKADALRELGISITFIGEKEIEKKVWRKLRLVKEKWYEITVAVYKRSDDKNAKKVYSLAANLAPSAPQAVAKRRKKSKIDSGETENKNNKLASKKNSRGLRATMAARKTVMGNGNETTAGMSKIDPNKYTAMLQRKHSELMAGHYSRYLQAPVSSPLTSGVENSIFKSDSDHKNTGYRNLEMPTAPPSVVLDSGLETDFPSNIASPSVQRQTAVSRNSTTSRQPQAKEDGGKIEKLLLKKNITAELATKTAKLTLIKTVSTFSDLQHIVETLCGCIETTKLFKKDSGGLLQKRFVFFSGSVGVGKTTSLFKVASFLRQQGGVGLSVASFDQQRLMAPMQLEQFCRILAVPYRRLANEEDLLRLEEECGSSQTVLVDLGGIAVGKNTVNEIAKLRGKLCSQSHMIYFVDATHKLEDMLYGFKKAEALKADSLALCKLDETRNIGDVISFAETAKLPVSSLFYGTDIPHDYCQATQKSIAEKIIKNWQNYKA